MNIYSPRTLADVEAVAANSSASRRDRSIARIATILIAGVVAALLAAIFLRLMTFELRKDELLYTAPIGLPADVALYRDVFYNHVPGSAWLFRAVAAAMPVDGVLLAGRVAVFLGWLVFAASLLVISWRMTRSHLVTGTVAILVLANDLLLGVTGMTATNNLLPLPFAFIGLGLFTMGALGRSPRPLLVFLAGASLAVAATMKASAGVFIPFAVLAALVAPAAHGIGQRLRTVVVPLALGGLIAAAPVISVFAADPELFLAHVVGYHSGPHLAYWTANAASEPGLALTFAERLRFAYEIWFAGTPLVLLLAAVAIAIARIEAGGLRHAITPAIAFALVCVAAALASSLIPAPSFPQYFAPALAALPLLLIALCADWPGRSISVLRPVLLAGIAIAVVANVPRLSQDATKALKPSAWTVARIHDDGQRIRAAVADRSGPVATMLPIYAYEAGLPVVRELAVGEFAYRTMPYTSPDLAKWYRAVGPDGITAVLDRDPPAAFLLGYDRDLETPLRSYAEDHGYVAVPDLVASSRYGDGVLYVRDNAGGPAPIGGATTATPQ